MKIKKLIEMECDAEFVGLTLLSANEYTENMEFIKPLGDCWWLRSPGYYGYDASYVSYGGSLSSDVYSVIGSVRPALILNPESSLLVGDKFIYYDHNWTVISAQYALCDEKFCRMAFRKDWRVNDANDYEASDIKRYLDSEWNKMIEGEDVP